MSSHCGGGCWAANARATADEAAGPAAAAADGAAAEGAAAAAAEGAGRGREEPLAPATMNDDFGAVSKLNGYRQFKVLSVHMRLHPRSGLLGDGGAEAGVHVADKGDVQQQ